jgi:hypothetical protein
MPRREDVERELRERESEEARQRSGSTPTEDVVERALALEPLEVEEGVEWHAGEDAGEVPGRDDEEPEETGASPT